MTEPSRRRRDRSPAPSRAGYSQLRHPFAPQGAFSDDEIANMGPLSSLVSASWVSWATSWHKGWGKTILIFLVVLHLLALAWYTWLKRQALVSAMWHGDKTLPHEIAATRDNGPSRAMALLVLAISALAVFGLVSLGA